MIVCTVTCTVMIPLDLTENGVAAANFGMLGLGDIVIPGTNRNTDRKIVQLKDRDVQCSTFTYNNYNNYNNLLGSYCDLL